MKASTRTGPPRESLINAVRWRSARYRVLASIIILAVNFSALAQIRKTNNSFLQLGAVVVVIPAPDGFEEAASQFEGVKSSFTLPEDPGNDMLAVHLLTTDCDGLRRGEPGQFNFYTKISVRKAVREVDFSAAEFAAIPAEFHKSGAALLDLNGPRMKATLEHLDKGLSELTQNQTKIEMSQPENLGEFDNRPSVYSVMLLLTYKFQSGDTQRVTPVLGGLSFVRVKQRLLYVNTYRKYESKADLEVLRDFTRQWINAILAAN
jgi:hypothetical protein